MSHLHQDHDDGAFRAFYDRHYPSLESNTTTLGSKALATLAGIYFVFKALEALGYPVWLWVHMAAEKTASLQFIGTPSASGEASEGDAPGTMAQKGGNVLSRLFGLSGTNLLQKGVQGVRALSTSTGSGLVPPGLGNWDNSCFQNSVIQGLASLPSLHEYLSKTTSENRSFNADTTNGALFDIIRQLSNPNHPGGHFWIRGKLKNMSTFQQQDAQEYYSKVLDALDKEMQSAASKRRRSSVSWSEVAKSLNGKDSKDGEKTAANEEHGEDSKALEKPTILPNPLDGLLAQRVGCINCGYSEGLQLIPFNCLTVSLGATEMCDIRDCLDEYTTLEYIEGVECAKCTLLNYRDTISKLATTNALFATKLQAVEEALEDDDFDDKTLIKKFNILKKNWKTTTKSKQAVIARAPKALVMHVNRSIFDEWTGYQRKNNAHVAYPRILDLGNWCLGERPSETSAPDNAMEEWPRDPTKSMLGDTQAEPVVNSPFQYRLRAAVTHSGTHGSGHYICYRLHPKKPDVDGEGEDHKPSEQWWRFSDESVWPVSEEQAHQGNVFMLFYERIDQPTVPVFEDAAAQANIAPIPLPPAYTISQTFAIDPDAISTALPPDSDEDDDLSLPDLTTADTDIPTPSSSIPSTPSDPEFSESPSTAPPPLAEPKQQKQEQPSATPSEADSEDTQDTQSTLMTSEDESTVLFDAKQLKLMRTAGEMEVLSQAQGQDDAVRRGLPMVTAT